MIKHHLNPDPPKPRRASRLPQMNKSNRLMRRYYSGRVIPPPVIARPVWAPLED